MTKNYMQALAALYGDAGLVPATTTPAEARSSRYGEKNRLPHTSTPKRRQREAGFQMKLVQWLWSLSLPVLSVPNEGDRGQHATHRLKQMGMWPGASDLFLARRTAIYGGYWLELKAPGKRVRENQADFLRKMRAEGYCTNWFDDLAEAQQSIMDYLNGMVIDAKQF